MSGGISAGQLDSNGEQQEVEDLDERNFGRLNLDLARSKGGNDCQNFLKHKPVDLLYYYWDVMDHTTLSDSCQ